MSTFKVTTQQVKRKDKKKTKWLQMIYSLSLRISLPGNRSSKSLISVMKWQILIENLIIARLGLLLGNQWQSPIFEESISTSSFLKIFNVVSFKLFWSVLSGVPLISRHSRLAYCELLQHWCSKETICSFSLLLTCLATLSSESNLM